MFTLDIANPFPMYICIASRKIKLLFNYLLFLDALKVHVGTSHTSSNVYMNGIGEKKILSNYFLFFNVYNDGHWLAILDVTNATSEKIESIDTYLTTSAYVLFFYVSYHDALNALGYLHFLVVTA